MKGNYICLTPEKVKRQVNLISREEICLKKAKKRELNKENPLKTQICRLEY